MSWLFSQALAVEYSGASSSGGPPSALSKSNHTPQAYWCSDRTTGSSIPSLSGITYSPLTADRGAELLTSFLAASRVKTSRQQVAALVSKASDQDSGRKWRESLARYDLPSRSWRTHQCLLFQDSTEFLATLPRWGMTVDMEFFPLPMLAHNTNAKGAGSLLTVTKFDSHNRPGSAPNNTLTFWAKTFGAGTARGGTLSEIHAAARETILNPCFCESLMIWPIMWTALRPLATDRFRQWRRSHGTFSAATHNEKKSNEENMHTNKQMRR